MTEVVDPPVIEPEQTDNRLITVDKNGLNLPDLAAILNYFITNMQQIYGNDTDFSQNTPDGQFVNLITQATADLTEIMRDIYNSFDPKLARGAALDRDVAYNGIYRNGGSYTIQPVQIETDRAVSLKGLDENYNDPQGQGFTVSDAEGNQWILITSKAFNRRAVLNFRAATMGNVVSGVDTITNIVTPIAGVLSVNNYVAPIEYGTLEESDEHLAYRREQSVALGGVGSVESIKAALFNTTGVTLAFVAENDTNITDTVHNMEPHSIWVIVQGGDTNEIANTLYQTVNQGVSMKGAIKVSVPDPWGNLETFYFDRPSVEFLSIYVTIVPKDPATEYDENYIKEQLVARLEFTLYDTIDTNEITCLLQEINPDLVYTNVGIAKAGSGMKQILTNTNYNYIFSTGTAYIHITRGRA